MFTIQRHHRQGNYTLFVFNCWHKPNFLKMCGEHLRVYAFATTGMTCSHSCEYIRARVRCASEREREMSTQDTR